MFRSILTPSSHLTIKSRTSEVALSRSPHRVSFWAVEVGWMEWSYLIKPTKICMVLLRFWGKKVPDFSIPDLHAESPGSELEVLEDYLLLRGILNFRLVVYDSFMFMSNVSFLFISKEQTCGGSLQNCTGSRMLQTLRQEKWPEKNCGKYEALNWRSFGPERQEYMEMPLGKYNLLFDLFPVFPGKCFQRL